jgi:hypothetical protein
MLVVINKNILIILLSGTFASKQIELIELESGCVEYLASKFNCKISMYIYDSALF